MATTSRDSAPDVQAMDGFEGRYADLGGYIAGFERFDADADPAPLFVGLPDDACQSPHWGVVLKGRLTFRYTDGTSETATAGEAYYARPGHTPLVYAGTEIVEFSPAEDIARTMEVVMRNAGATA